MNTPPCHNCNTRSAECHASCKMYKDWCIKQTEMKKQYKAEATVEAQFVARIAERKQARSRREHLRNP